MIFEVKVRMKDEYNEWDESLDIHCDSEEEVLAEYQKLVDGFNAYADERNASKREIIKILSVRNLDDTYEVDEITLDTFVDITMNEIKKFKEFWQKQQNMIDGDNYPESMGESDWFEQFIIFVTTVETNDDQGEEDEGEDD